MTDDFNKEKTMDNNIKINKEKAIEIASGDRKLKDSIFRKWKNEYGIVLGLISFSKMDADLVKYKGVLAWYVKVLDGRWGGVETNDNGNVIHIDGVFKEPILCIVTCDTGDYYFKDDINSDDIKLIPKEKDDNEINKLLDDIQEKNDNLEKEEEV